MRTRDGATGKRIADCKASELKAIGFWVANENGQQLGRQLCRSVAEIEKETGFTFFPDADTSVKAQNSPEQWGFNRVFDKPSAAPDAVRAMPGRENEE